MRPWNVLVEATIQGATIQGTITCHSANEETAKKLARQTFIKNLRNSGVWIRVNNVEEPYQVDGPVDKKTGKPTVKTKFRMVDQYVAPYWDHVQAIEILPEKARDFTYCAEEIDDARYSRKNAPPVTKKRRTSDEVALASRKKKEAAVDKKEKRVVQQKKAEANKQSKAELLESVEAYFTGDEAKIVKDAVGKLSQTYQRIRYALFQIRDKGYNDAEYELEQSKVDGSAAFKLVKKG